MSHTVQGCKDSTCCFLLNPRRNILHKNGTTQRCASLKVTPFQLQALFRMQMCTAFQNRHTCHYSADLKKPGRSCSLPSACFLQGVFAYKVRFRHLFSSWARNCLMAGRGWQSACAARGLKCLSYKYCTGRNPKCIRIATHRLGHLRTWQLLASFIWSGFIFGACFQGAKLRAHCSLYLLAAEWVSLVFLPLYISVRAVKMVPTCFRR